MAHALAKLENGQTINHMLIVQHIESGDYDFSDCQTVEAAIDAACDEVTGEKHDGFREEMAKSIKWYWPSEALEAAEDGYGWPLDLGFVVEIQD